MNESHPYQPNNYKKWTSQLPEKGLHVRKDFYEWANSTSTNLSTRQLQINFSATWERSPWSGALVANWLLWNEPHPHQPTYQPNNYKRLLVLPKKDLHVQERKSQIGFYEMSHLYINQLINQTTTNELQCYLRKISMLRKASMNEPLLHQPTCQPDNY